MIGVPCAVKPVTNALIRIAQPIFLASEIADIRNVQHRALRKLDLRSEARLFNIGRPLIGILRPNLQSWSDSAMPGRIGRRKAILQEKAGVVLPSDCESDSI